MHTKRIVPIILCAGLLPVCLVFMTMLGGCGLPVPLSCAYGCAGMLFSGTWTLPLGRGYEIWNDGETCILVRSDDPCDPYASSFAVRVAGNITAYQAGERFIRIRRRNAGKAQYFLVDAVRDSVYGPFACGEDFDAACARLGCIADGAWARAAWPPLNAVRVASEAYIFGAATPRQLERIWSEKRGLPRPESALYLDTHGGFHGDGETFARLQFSAREGDALARLLAQSDAWHALPLPPALAACAGREPMSNYAYFQSRAALDWGENGWWQFRDRQRDSSWPDASFLGAYSKNYTLYVFDADANALYFYQLDT